MNMRNCIFCLLRWCPHDITVINTITNTITNTTTTIIVIVITDIIIIVVTTDLLRWCPLDTALPVSTAGVLVAPLSSVYKYFPIFNKKYIFFFNFSLRVFYKYFFLFSCKKSAPLATTAQQGA